MKIKSILVSLMALCCLENPFAQGIYIQPGAYVTVQDNAKVTTTGSAGLTIKSTSGGTGSLISHAGGISFLESGTASVERYIDNNNAWHFLSFPVTPGDITIWPEFTLTPNAGVFSSPYTWDFYYWNPNCSYTNGLPWVSLRLEGGTYNNGSVEATGNGAGFGDSPAKFETGRGYLVAYSSSWSGTTHTFSGALNAGEKSRTITKNITVQDGNAWNLAGNPYPSAIDWAAASGWNRDNVAVNVSSGAGYDYWTITSSGNYGVCNSANPGAATLGTSRYIAPMQAFFVKAATTGTFSMNDNVRVHSSQTWLKSAEQQPGILRLELHADANAYYDEMIVQFDPAFKDGGSSKFGSLYPEAPELYAIKDGSAFSINSYTTFDPELVVRLGAKCGVAGNYTIIATNIAGFNLSNLVILEDLKTGNKVNLKETGAYSFYGAPADNRERFRLTFSYGTNLPQGVAGPQVYSFTTGRDLFLGTATPVKGTCDIMVFDLAGRTVFVGGVELVAGKQRITTLPGAGTYIVRMTAGTETSTSKVLVN